MQQPLSEKFIEGLINSIDLTKPEAEVRAAIAASIKSAIREATRVHGSICATFVKRDDEAKQQIREYSEGLRGILD